MTILFQYLSHSAFSIILEVCIVHAPAAGIILCFHLSPVICLPNTPKREFKRYGIHLYLCTRQILPPVYASVPIYQRRSPFLDYDPDSDSWKIDILIDLDTKDVQSV
jgi:hypothetical protein